ncbi:MAG: hypothetical protein D6798_15485, partial [Deltaproteobacteria bacterium]
PEVARHLAMLDNRVPRADYLAAIPWFVERAEEVEPLLISELRGGGPGAARAADLLGRLGLPSSVPALAEALGSDRMTVRSAAGMALAVHPAPMALESLAEAARSGTPEAATAALDGLAVREGDPGVCPAISAAMARDDEAILHHARLAAQARGC